MDDVQMRLASLERRVETLEGRRPGRRALPILVSEPHVCGVDPSSDSTKCPYASLYRHQKGCKGDHCVRVSQIYYENRRHRPSE